MSDEFEANYRGKDETPESKAALENLNQVIDRIIDAYARAVALATAPEYAAKKAEWTTQLTTFYKFRHNDSDAGLQELIAGVLSKPLPPQPTLVATPVPATTSAPATTPAPPPEPHPADARYRRDDDYADQYHSGQRDADANANHQQTADDNAAAVHDDPGKA